MKPLKAYDEQEFQTFEAIVDDKDEPGKGLLKGLAQTIRNRYTEYAVKVANLQTLLPSALGREARIACRSCYDSPELWKSVINDAVRGLQPNELRGRCPYCGTAPPDTLDHYVPRSRFPEFSVLTRNLIPCCGRCNLLKREKWLRDGQRVCLNVYYDTLPAERCVFAEVMYDDSLTPSLKFCVDGRAGVADPVLSAVKLHFETLRLYERLPISGNDVITETRNTLVRFDVTNPADAQVLLEEQTRDFARQYGANHYKTAISEALAASDDFLLEATYASV